MPTFLLSSSGWAGGQVRVMEWETELNLVAPPMSGAAERERLSEKLGPGVGAGGGEEMVKGTEAGVMHGNRLTK